MHVLSMVSKVSDIIGSVNAKRRMNHTAKI